MRRLIMDVESEVKTDIVLIVLTGFSIFSFISLAFADNMGFVGGFLNRLITNVFGAKGSWVLPIFLLLWCIGSFLNRQLLRISGRMGGALLLAFFTIIYLHLTIEQSPEIALQTGLLGLGGGIVGGISVTVLYRAFGLVGMRVVVVTGMLTSLLLISQISLMNLVKFALKLSQRLGTIIWSRVTKRNNKTMTHSESVPALIVTPEYEEEEVSQTQVLTPKGEENVDETTTCTSTPMLSITPLDDDYQIPKLELLNTSKPKGGISRKQAEASARKLEQTLINFGVSARVSKVSLGPSITRYEIQTAPGTKVSKVTSLSDDIALSLAARDVRIEAPIPGKSAIGIEVPNMDTVLVSLYEVLQDAKFSQTSHPLTIGFGQDVSGVPVIYNLANMPHLLIAGATGSGKSVCINVIIASILFKAHPKQVRFLMIDPKRVELSSYDGIPHLLAPVVTEPKKAATALRWIADEMDKRYTKFAKVSARDIERYNAIAEASSQEEVLPLIVVIIDELADLMMVASGDVEDAICRVAQMGRAAGIHLVVGTQRPSVDVITGLIKANIPARIAFAVSSGVDSRTILDINGAEKLLGKGDMLFNHPGMSKPLRVQGAYVSDDEVEKVVEFASNQIEIEYEKEEFKAQRYHEQHNTDIDELFPDAVRLVVEQGQASVSLLQRRFRIGYTRAARIIDQMELKGAIGPYEGSKPRQVYPNSEAVRKILLEDRVGD